MPPHVLIHVITGGVAVLAGAIALTAPKGRPWHVGAGRVFTVAMLISSALGAVMGALKYETHLITLHAGVLACCLLLSSWLSARKLNRSPAAGLAAIVNAANMAGLITVGTLASYADGGTLFGHPPGNYLFLAGMALVGSIGDIHVFMRARISDRHRIARHLWRMCLGFFIAAGSLFTGPGANAFPEAVRASGALSVPEPLILLVMVFWLVRTFWPARRPN